MFKENKFIFKSPSETHDSLSRDSVFGEILAMEEAAIIASKKDLLSLGTVVSGELPKDISDTLDALVLSKALQEDKVLQDRLKQLGPVNTALLKQAANVAALKRSIANAKNLEDVAKALEDSVPEIIRELRIGSEENEAIFEKFITTLKSLLKEWFGFIYEKPTDDAGYDLVIINDCGFDPNQKGDISIWVPKN